MTKHIFVIALLLSITACSENYTDTEKKYMETSVRQQATIGEQINKSQEQLENYAAQQKRSADILDAEEKRAVRLDKIIEKWEEQAKRYDAILARMEKRK